MSRQARTMSKTGYYHIIMRGNNKDYIFQSEDDKAFFKDILFSQQDEGLISIVAWCLMDNHVHLLLKAELVKLSLALKRVNIRFAMRYHKKHNSVGHVFQDRFKSEPIETEEYLMLVTRYIHNNPVKAKMVENATDYKWSSYNSYLRYQDAGFNDTMKFIYCLFNNDKEIFKVFHENEDDREYLEIREDQERYRKELAQNIITRVCDKYDIVEEKEIYLNKEILEEILKEMIQHSGLSLRGIAKFVEAPYSMVHASKQRWKRATEKNRLS